MKKQIMKIITAWLIVTALISLFTVAAFAIGVDFTASLSVSRRMNYVGDEVNFIVHIENAGYDLDTITISNTRGGIIAHYYEEVEKGESVDIPVTKVFSAAGEFGVKFKVYGSSEGEGEIVETNTVTVTINAVPTPTPEPTPAPEPTQQPTQQPTLQPTQQPTQTLAATPTPAEIAAFDEETEGGQSQTPKEQADAQSAEAEQEGSNNTVLYIILAVVGAMLLAAVAVIIMLKRKMKTDRDE